MRTLHATIDELADLRARIETTVVPEPPLSLSDGGVIQRRGGERTGWTSRSEPQ